MKTPTTTPKTAPPNQKSLSYNVFGTVIAFVVVV